jgi:hypothetical protein
VADAVRAAGRNFLTLLTAAIAASGVLVPVGGVAYALWRWRQRRAAAPRPPATAPRAAPAA